MSEKLSTKILSGTFIICGVVLCGVAVEFGVDALDANNAAVAAMAAGETASMLGTPNDGSEVASNLQSQRNEDVLGVIGAGTSGGAAEALGLVLAFVKSSRETEPADIPEIPLAGAAPLPPEEA